MLRAAPCFTPLAALLAALAGVSPLAAWDGELDSDGFNSPLGYVIHGSAPSVARAGLIGPDGVAVSVGQTGATGITWARVLPDGAVGLCTFVPASVTAAGAEAGLFDEQGRLVVTGSASYSGLGQVLFVARFLYPACTLDPAFDGDGYFTLDGTDNLVGIEIATTRVPSSFPGVFFERLLVAGDSRPTSGSDLSDLLLVRLRADGTPDPGFGGGDGVAVYDFDAESNFSVDLEVDRFGRVLVTGAIDFFGPDPDAMLMRATADGTLDGTFGEFGWVRWNCGTTGAGEDLPAAVLLEASGRVHVVSTWLYDATGSTHGVCDTDLGLDGEALERELLVNLGDAGVAVHGAVLQGNGRLIVVGESDTLDGDRDLFALATRLPGWTPDPDWGDSGDFVTHDLDLVVGGDERAFAVALQDGRPVLFGSAETASGSRALVVRLENAYLFADGFERGSTGAW